VILRRTARTNKVKKQREKNPPGQRRGGFRGRELTFSFLLNFPFFGIKERGDLTNKMISRLFRKIKRMVR